MSEAAAAEYVAALRPRHPRAARRKGKTLLLDEAYRVTRRTRKYMIVDHGTETHAR